MEKDTDRKPVVTCHGEQELFSSIQAELLQALQRDPMEWRRSYGRAPKVVFVDVNFVQFNADILPKENDRHLLRKPFFHTYWTDCADADAYKLVVKDEISSWQQMLREHNVQDWMIILVETSNPKRGQKPKLSLPRSSVADKIKSDFCSRQSDRVIVLHEPHNPVPTPRSIESWQNFLQRLRQLVLVSYNRVLGKFEEMVRGERERRNEKGWEFCRYFLLQEELAFTFETLHQYEDALVQYDELDALFSQFIINSQAGENPEWLTAFTGTCNCWDGLNLSQAINLKKRKIIENDKPTLLDIRNYLFSRQCTLLFSLQRPHEVAHRAQAFMHNVVQELSILEIPMPTGSIACWVFLSCLEVLQMCEKRSDAGSLEKYSHYTASLWVYAQSKLRQLGELCGLMPDTSPTSEQLHMVVGLLGGMAQTQEASVRENSPCQKLREALSSSDAFQKHYLELSELAMGTFKHIARMRSARLIGKDLAKFYIKKGELNKAETFLTDAMRIYEKEGWALPASHTRKQIAECQKLQQNKLRYLKTCCLLTGDPIMSEEDRLVYWQEVLTVAQDLATSSSNSQTEQNDELPEGATACVLPLMPMVDVSSATLKPENGKIGRNDTAEINFNLFSFLPKEVTFERLTVGLQHYAVDSAVPTELRRSLSQNSWKGIPTEEAQSGMKSVLCSRLLPSNRQVVQPLDLEEEVRYQPQANNVKMADASLLACRNAQTVLKREDSTSSLGRRQDVVQKEDTTVSLEKTDVQLELGMNELKFSFKPSDNGTYSCRQLVARLSGVDFVLPLTDMGISVQVLSAEPTLTVSPIGDAYLLAGIPQEITLSLFTGFYTVKADDTLTINTPSNVQILDSQQEEYTIKSEGNKAFINLGDMAPQSSLGIKIPIMAKLQGQDDEEEKFRDGVHEYEGTVSCPWNDMVTSTLTFQQPFRVSHRLHTAATRKCVQILVDSLCGSNFILSEPSLVQTSKGSLTLTAVHSHEALTLCSGSSVSFVWIVEVNDNGASEQNAVGLEFGMRYEAVIPGKEHTDHQYTHGFTLENYQTKFTVSSLVKPPSNQDLCRAGTLCTLELFIQSAVTNGHTIDQSGDSAITSLMYQIEADASMWAVCGRSKGVVATPIGEEVREVMLEVMPQIPGNLPLPIVKLSKYLNVEQGEDGGSLQAGDTPDDDSAPTSDDAELSTGDSQPSLLPFEPGQIYYKSMASQVLVLPESDVSVVEVQS